MPLSSRTLFLAGAVFALGSFSAGLVHCAQGDAHAVPAWQRLADPAVVQQATAAAYAPQAVPADARCPVCGMYPARFPAWGAQLVLRDGSARFFDSPREFFRFQADLARYGNGVRAEDIVAGYVTDHDQGGWVPATQAYYVRGSAVTGPMRVDALPAFASRVAAAAFVTRHGGTVLEFTQIGPADIGAAGSAHHHH